MAAALLQYQACLGIMVRLQVEDLALLKEDFDRAGRGLSLREFVNVMLDRVSWEPESVVSFIEDLVELFAQVDVNGDGTMEWEEFTSAIIEGGMGSSGGGNDDVAGIVAQLRDLQYEEHPRFVDTAVNRPPKRIEYLPEFRRVLLLESSRPVVELLDPAGLFPPENDENAKEGSGAASGEKEANGESNTEDAIGSTFSFTPTLPVLNKFHPLCYISGYRRDQDEVRSERSPVQAIKYLSGLDLLAVSAGDLKLTFWSSTLLTACSTSAMETPRPLAIVHTPRPQRVLEWCSKTQQLFSISADLMISVWQVTTSQNISVKAGNAKSRGEASDGTCEVRLATTLKKHSDLLQDLLILNDDTLLSCGMDNMIYLWETHTLQTRASRQGHRRGVRLMVKFVWRWEVDVTGAAAFKRKQAEQLWDELKGSKLKAAALRQQSVAMAKRAEKRATMVASASTPALGQGTIEIQRMSFRGMTGSSSTSAIEISRVIENNGEEVAPDEEQPEENDTTDDHTKRLFDQLQGKTTWKKSDLQLARQAAWEKERVKFQQRMKKVMRQKAKKKKEENSVAEGNQHEDIVSKHQPNGDVNDSLGKLEVLGGAGDADDPGMLLPTLQNPVQELPFADKDNWAVGSLNREQQMYEHFHRENVRRNNKQIAGSSGLLRQRRLENSLASMDLTPSAFLLEKLGVSCIIRGNVELKDLPGRRKMTKKPPRPKRVAALTKAHSLTALPSPPTVNLGQSEPTLTSSVSTSVLPRRSLLSTLCQQYDELLGEDHEDNSRSSPQPPSNGYLSGSQTSSVSSPSTLDDDNLTPVDTATGSSSIDEPHSMSLASTKSNSNSEDKQGSPRPTRYRHPRSAITAKERGPKLRQGTPSSNSAGAVRPVPRASVPKKEFKSAKKVRIRSDAALMRQERFGPYSRDDVINVYRTFRKLDQDQSGSITLRELLNGSGLFAGTHMQDNIGSIFSSIDKDQSGLIDLAELCGVVFGEAPPEVLEDILRLCRLLETVEKTRRVQRKTLTVEQVQELRELFRLYDTDDNGDIDAGELLEALRYNERFYDSDRRGSSQLTKEDVMRIISAFDVNANASLDLEEFIELFREDA
ncbi:Guanine nucleotide-binding protein subunit beta protein [Phytophthora cinnamomi]|uniref:Guanine nucleotide-binding protein subunit beta protein n=1 Tax=Phytophthora cinnamomi TaxID=4785 RepID=UPI00355ABC9C|nr:Guanine nucleotide-binding protein subunit beta protein [Phytophthora cinnamomi]